MCVCAWHSLTSLPSTSSFREFWLIFTRLNFDLIFHEEKWVKHTHAHPFNGPLSGTTQVSRYQKGKTSLDFTEARDNEWQWNLLGHMQVCTSLQTDNYTSTPLLSFLQTGCPSCCPANSVKALKAPETHSMVICLERGADLRMAQRIPLPLTVSCFSKIQTLGIPYS